MRQPQHGFTLIEMTVAVFIIALLLGSILVPLATQVEQRQISDTQKAMEEIKEALIGFAIANGYLPCPDKTAGVPPFLPNDTPLDGIEDFFTVGVNAGTCVTAEGNVPWATLGVTSSDPWGNRFRYRVDPDFAQRAPFAGAPFSLASSADLRVCTLSACVAGTLLTSAGPNGAAAVILSHGKNGLGAINSNTNTANAAPSSPDEQANTDGNTTFVYRPPTPVGSAAGEFDDIVSWVSKFTLFNRMVAAGKLP